MDTLVNSLNEFSFDLFQIIHNSRTGSLENTVLSSFSVFIAMFMSLIGARNKTKSEILKSVKIDHFVDSDLESLNNLIKKLINDEILQKSYDDHNKIVLANKVIVDNIQLDNIYENALKDVFNANINRYGSSIVDETNKWISDLTNKKIENIIDENFFKGESCLVLINAIYFKYDWKYQFDERLTQKDIFTANGQHSIQVDMMHLEGKYLPYLYSDALNSHIFSLPYASDMFSLNIIFPDSENDFLIKSDNSSLINKLSYTTLKNELLNKNLTLFNLYMPKFKINKKIQLNSILRQLGINEAFDSGLANFSGISETKNLYIEEALQYAYIEINEKGTEAAAATVVKISKRSISETLEIRLNRPFIYFITSHPTNSILFIGSFNGLSNTETPAKINSEL